MSAAERTALTYRYERLRALSAGILESAGTTFLLTIAVREFHSGPVWKAAIAGGSSLGLLFTPAVVSWVTHRGLTPSRAASRLFIFGALGFGAAFAASLMDWLPVYALGSMLAMASAAAVIPLFTHIYQENYPEVQRGRLFSRTVMIRIGTVAIFSEIAGYALAKNFDWFRGLLVMFGAALVFGGICLARIPSHPIHDEGGAHPFRAMRFVRTDAIFRRTLICWMLMGFANLMMLPLRVEYLANPKYGVNPTGPFVEWFSQVAPGVSQWLFSPVGIVALATGFVPNVARLIMSPVWGQLFDRMNFFALRITLNIGFALGILTFFVSNSFGGLMLGAVIFGVSSAGGDVAWSLWVTKFAPPGRVADYMSVHTFFTGVRGVLAPIVAFALVQKLSFNVLAGISAALIVVASMLLVPEIKFGKRARRGPALVEEISE